ncbi:MAG: hypothetical protein COB85_04090 [Bacteroidetes bacterium]|nr:MAG: hypothetical protein COB85_04090 [Bacteroidota bacterium]
MNSNQENKLSMYYAVQKVCADNNSVWTGLPAFVNAFGEFEAVIQGIQDNRVIQERDIKGVTQDKGGAADELIDQAFKVSTAVHAYATEVGNNTLREKINYSLTDFGRARDTVIIDICQLIHDEAKIVVADLVDYGIKTADLADLLSKLSDYELLVAGPRNAITDRSTATGELDDLLKEGDDILKNKMDKLMNQFAGGDPEFVTQYTSMRKLVGMGGSGTGLKGRITDGATGDRIKNVTVEIPDMERELKTNGTGLYVFKQARPGLYSVRAEAKGYVAKEILEVELAEGKLNVLDIELDKKAKEPKTELGQLNPPG